MADLKVAITWSLQTTGAPTRGYRCGYCGRDVASQQGVVGSAVALTRTTDIRVCPLCTRPTFFDYDGKQIPGPLAGETVRHIPEESIVALYNEARKARSAGCDTACVLCCRKLLMHVAIAKGATEGASFLAYVEFFANNHLIPPNAHAWVDHIRQRGNEANHDIVLMSGQDADQLLALSGMLLKIIYEFPASIQASP